jgi:hypothetical protein
MTDPTPRQLIVRTQRLRLLDPRALARPREAPWQPAAARTHGPLSGPLTALSRSQMRRI